MIVIRASQEIGEEFRRWFAAEGKPQSDIARSVGVDQSTVSRLVAGRNPVYVTKPLRKLCEFAGIELNRHAEADAKLHIPAAILALWNGTDAQAAAIMKLLDAARLLIEASGTRRP